jgi:predicted RNA binding protein YcfA (HicA-like mRNA interferase family)
MKVRDILKRLKADGWESVAMVGSHEQFTHPTKPG